MTAPSPAGSCDRVASSSGTTTATLLSKSPPRSIICTRMSGRSSTSMAHGSPRCGDGQMGADNQAERVIARIEFREELAEIFNRALRKEIGLPPRAWRDLDHNVRRATLAGVTAMLERIEEKRT